MSSKRLSQSESASYLRVFKMSFFTLGVLGFVFFKSSSVFQILISHSLELFPLVQWLGRWCSDSTKIHLITEDQLTLGFSGLCAHLASTPQDFISKSHTTLLLSSAIAIVQLTLKTSPLHPLCLIFYQQILLSCLLPLPIQVIQLT